MCLVCNISTSAYFFKCLCSPRHFITPSIRSLWYYILLFLSKLLFAKETFKHPNSTKNLSMLITLKLCALKLLKLSLASELFRLIAVFQKVPQFSEYQLLRQWCQQCWQHWGKRRVCRWWQRRISKLLAPSGCERSEYRHSGLAGCLRPGPANLNLARSEYCRRHRYRIFLLTVFPDENQTDGDQNDGRTNYRGRAFEGLHERRVHVIS